MESDSSLLKANSGSERTRSDLHGNRVAEFPSSVTIQSVIANLSDFTAGLLHDLTTPYAALTGYLSLLLDRVKSLPGHDDSEEIATFIKGLRESQERFEGFVSRLRWLAEPLNLSLEPVPLCEVFRSVIEEESLSETIAKLRRGLSFKTRVRAGNDYALLDTPYFSMAMRTLLLAVVTSAEGRGSIRCTLDRTLSPEAPLLWEAIASEGAPTKKGFFRFTIRDGSGAWAGVELTQLFLPLQSNTPKRLHEVNRVEMAIAYQVIRAHGGFFRLTESRDGASLLMVYLPE